MNAKWAYEWNDKKNDIHYIMKHDTNHYITNNYALKIEINDRN